MTLANTPTKWLAAVTLALCLTPVAVAQDESSTQPKAAASNQASQTPAVKPRPVMGTTSNDKSKQPAKSTATAAAAGPSAGKSLPAHARSSKETKSATATGALSLANAPTSPKPTSSGQSAKAPGVKSASAKATTANTTNPEKAAKAGKNAAEASVVERPFSVATRRDPFLPLVSERKEMGGPGRLPPGKGGLVISTVRVDGTVRSEEGMIAVLSNADQRTYFVREGDRLYDGAVEKISLEGVTFRQDSKDAFGKPVERVVTKRIYATAGEQQ